jgi:hypothetical protein
MAIGDVYKLSFFQTVHGNPVMSVMHFLETIAPSDFDLVASSLAGWFHDDFAANLATILSEDWVGVGVQVYRVKPGPMNPYSTNFTGAGALVGEIVSEAIPSNSPLVVSWYTDLPSKRGRGRWYQSGIPESWQDCGQIIDANFGTIVAAFSNIDETVEEAGAGAGRWRACVYSRINDSGEAIQSYTVRPNLANMRPRRSPPSTV